MSEREFRATVFLRFSVSDEKMKEYGFDVEMPPAGFLYDDIMTLLDGDEGVIVVGSAVVKECTPLPTHQEAKGVICDGCHQIKTTLVQNNRGKLCVDCFGTVIPLGQLPSQ